MWKWILLVLQSIQPHAPQASRYEEIAHAIDDVAHVAPVYDSNDKYERTAAELIAVVRFESSFDPDAVGDHGQSIGLGQIGVSNLHRLGLSKSDLFDVRKNLLATAKMLRESHRVCRGRPIEEQLAAYATGRGLCDVSEGRSDSIHRMQYARWILRTYRPFWTDAVAQS